MRHSFPLLLVLICLLSITDLPLVEAKKKNSKKDKAASKLKNAIKDEKIKVKSNKCSEIEDENLLFNCLYYNMSSKCFLKTFGNRGLELGEVFSDKAEKDYNSCWKTEKDYYKNDPADLKVNQS